MSTRRPLLVLLGAMLAALAVLPVRTAAAAAPAADAEPGLGVEVTSVTPSALRPDQPLELTGTVTNSDVHGWREVNAYLVISPEPVTTSGALSRLAASPAETYISDRITDIGRFDPLGPLPTGESTGFDLRLPYRALPISGAEGVYTVGVQVLATDVDDTRKLEGRTRTFVPLVAAQGQGQGQGQGRPARVDLGIVWPLRAPLLRRSDGSYLHDDELRQSMAIGGRLRRTADLAVSADVPLSTVADPALLDAAHDIGEGQFGPPVLPPRPGDGQTEDPPDPAAEGAAGSVGGDEATNTSPAARQWLGDVSALLDTESGWLTRYGEPDEQAVAAAPSPRLDGAIARATRATADALLTEPPGLASLPVDGAVQPAALAALARQEGDRLAVLTPQQLEGWTPAQGAALAVPTVGGAAPVLVADPDLSAGGPATDDPDSALQVRQRLLAETLLAALAATARGDEQTSAVFVPPDGWNPGVYWPAAGFFSGLRTPWLRVTPVDRLLREPVAFAGSLLDAGELRASGADGDTPDTTDPATDPAADRTVLPDLVETSGQLVRRSRTLARLLGGDPALARWYDASAALGMSSYWRDDGRRRLTVTRHTVTELGRQLGRVSIEGPPFVTLSSSRGRFGVTITNNLDRPVTVGVRVAAAGTALEFDAGEPVTVGPGERQTVTVDTTVGDNRVTAAEAYLVTRHGERFGDPLTFSLRTSVVGMVIWGVLAVAGLILVVAIARRIVRRVRGHDRPARPWAATTR